MTVAELARKLESLPQDKQVVCQVVGQQEGVWMMGYEFFDTPYSLVQLRIEHPMLKVLPEINFEDTERKEESR